MRNAGLQEQGQGLEEEGSDRPGGRGQRPAWQGEMWWTALEQDVFPLPPLPCTQLKGLWKSPGAHLAPEEQP